jgi:hypothetical protein
MSDAPKLLTEAEAIVLLSNIYMDKEVKIAELRERGLIAPDPVDPLLVEARNVVGDYAAKTNGYEIYEAVYRQGKRDSDSEVQVALAALRRGMELTPAARPLTREMVREAVIGAIGMACIDMSDFTDDNAFDEYKQDAEDFIDRLHAALTEAQQ